MGFKSYTLRLFAATIFICTSASVNNVQGQDHASSRFSLTANGGINFGNFSASKGIPVMRSNLSRLTQHTVTFGSGLQYAISPAWSLETGYKYSNVRGETGDFASNVHTLSVKNIVDLNQIFALSNVLPIINPYFSGGIGYDFFTFSSPSEYFNGNSISYNVGVGLALKATKNIDLITHYEYHFASNTIDNINTGINTDLLTTLTAGLRFNFGALSKMKKRNARSSRPPAPVDVPFNASASEDTDPVKVSPSENAEPVEATVSDVSEDADAPLEYDDFASVTRKIQHLEEDINRLEQEIAKQERQYKENSGNNTGAADHLTQRVEDMEMLLQALQNKLSDVTDITSVSNNSGSIVESVAPGSYIQIFSSDKLSSAEEVRNNAVSYLGNRLNGPSEKVFIRRYGDFYQVLIGEFSNNAKAARIKSTMASQHSDAFIIVFPRPRGSQ